MPTRYFPCLTQTPHRAPCDRQNKKQTGRHATGDTFVKRQRNWGFVICFRSPLGSSCCSAGVTAIGGCKSRSSLSCGCSAVIFDPVVSQRGGFPKFVRESQLCAHIPSHKSHLLHQACQVDLWLSAGNCISLLPCFKRRKFREQHITEVEAELISGCDKSSAKRIQDLPVKNCICCLIFYNF